MKEALVIREQQPGSQMEADGDASFLSLPGAVPEKGASSFTEGNKTLLVIRVDFSDLTGAPKDGSGATIDATYLTNRMQEVSAWIDEVSYGKSSMTLQGSDVTGVLRMPQSAASYSGMTRDDHLRDDALALAQVAGFTLSNYDRIAMVFSDLGTLAGVTYGGLGEIGSEFTWYNGNFSFGIATHEFGHNYGLRHANRWQIPGGSTDPVDPAGSSVEYGDVFDMMGSSSSDPATNPDHFNPWFLNRIDWLTDVSVKTVTTNGTYRLHRYDHKTVNPGNQLALKIERTNNENYWIGYRRKYVGHPSRSDVSDGAYVIWGYNTATTSNLIDLDTPGTNPNDASLNVGDSFQDSAAGITLSVLSAGGSGVDEYLDVSVSYQPRIAFSASSYDVDEASGNLAVQLTRSSNSSGAVSLTLATVNGMATSPADFTAVSTTVSWADGDDAPKTVNIPIIPDAIVEGSESFQIQLSGITGGIIVNDAIITANIREPGATDPSFTHDFFTSSSTVEEMALQPDGQIAFVGRASNISVNFTNEPVGGVGRFNTDGSLDLPFSAGASVNSLPIGAIARQADGKFIIGGSFTMVGTTGRNRFARIDTDGTLDTSFDPGTGANGSVNAIAVRPDGRILIGGAFTQINGVARQGIAQLLPDGSLDTTFVPPTSPSFTAFEVLCLAVQADGKVLVGGQIFTSGFQTLFSGGFSSGLLRLELDGSIDSSFDIGTGAHESGNIGFLLRVYAVQLQPNGQVLAGGNFTAFNGTDANRLVRLNANGSVDTAFVTALGSGADDLVATLYVQGDGKILVGGRFSTLAGVARPRVARLDSTSALDSNFDASISPTYSGTFPNYCNHILMQPDTRILIALDEFSSGQTGLKRVFSAQSAPTGIVEFGGGSVTVNEGQTATLAVSRRGGSLGAISVSYATLTGTADTSDFVSKTGVLTWADGDSADKLITIDTTADASQEPNELLAVQLGTPIGAAHLGESATNSITIADPTPIEAWRLANFSTTANTGDAADGSDPDFDSLLNLLEYGIGSLPKSAAGTDGVQALPSASTAEVEAVLAGRLVLVSELPDPTPSDLTYAVEVNGSLDSGTWTTLATKTGAGAWTWLGGGTSRIVESSSAGRSTVKVGDTMLMSAGLPRFMRLRVTRP